MRTGWRTTDARARVDNHFRRLVVSSNPKAAGDVVIGGLRCNSCGALYAPKGESTREICNACLVVLLQAERFPLGRIARARRLT